VWYAFYSNSPPGLFFFFSVLHHLPCTKSQFNKWHTQHLWLCSSLFGSITREQPLVHSPSHQGTIVATRLQFYVASFYLLVHLQHIRALPDQNILAKRKPLVYNSIFQGIACQTYCRLALFLFKHEVMLVMHTVIFAVSFKNMKQC
jgi:hypothetical protein